MTTYIRRIFPLLAVALNFSLAHAEYTQATPRWVVGADYALPYMIAIEGDAVNRRNNMNLGVESRYFFNDNINAGLRFSTDLEERNGLFRQYIIAPQFFYQWFQGQTWMPYFRGDVPVVLSGAPSALGSSDQMDFGVSIGSGLAWNLGNQIGLDHLIFRYDFNISYFFGIGDALNRFGVEFLRVGAEYRF